MTWRRDPGSDPATQLVKTGTQDGESKQNKMALSESGLSERMSQAVMSGR